MRMELKWLEHKGTTKFITDAFPRHSVSHQNPEVPSGRIHDDRLPTPRGYHGPVHPRTTTTPHIAGVQNSGARGGRRASMRRGYHRRELDRMWVKFLVQWWKAEEVRRGELGA